MSGEAGLTRVALPDLETMLKALAQGLRWPLTEAGLTAHGLAHAVPHLGILEGLDRAAAEAVLRVAVAERRRRPVPAVELVWTGPEARASEARDTAVVVRRLFSKAQSSVLVAGFRFDHGAEILRPLYTAMKERGVEAAIYLDIDGKAPSPSEIESFAGRAVEAFLSENWPFGDPRPAVYYDPRTLAPGLWASLHAKCIVVDERRALVTSANFTDRGQTRNIEAGVLIEDPGFAARLAGQWRGLRDTGTVKKYSPH